MTYLFNSLSQILSYGIAVVMTALIIITLQPIAKKIGLVDMPDNRKQHSGEIPLIGGVAMFIGFSLSLVTLKVPLSEMRSYLFAIILLMIMGVMDDYKELSVRSRFAIELVAATVLVSSGGIILYSLGDLFSLGNVHLKLWAIPFTVVCIVGLINAMNMSDGINGLAGGYSFVTFASLFYLSLSRPELLETKIIIIFMCVLIPFLVFNLQMFGKRTPLIFMGDAGSAFLGFSCAWLLIKLTQIETPIMQPVVALWIFALPLFDMFSIMLRRLLKRKSPFKPDNEHFHHLFVSAGVNKNLSLIVPLSIAVIFSVIGISMYKNGVPEYVSFGLFMFLFFIYFFVVKHVWKIMQGQVRDKLS